MTITTEMSEMFLAGGLIATFTLMFPALWVMVASVINRSIG